MGMSAIYLRFSEKKIVEVAADPYKHTFGSTNFDKPEMQEIMLDIDQAWQGIAQLFAGRDFYREGAGTLADVIIGGEVLAVVDEIAFRLFRPKTVQTLATELSSLTDEQFKALYDPAKTSEGADAVADYLLPHFKALVQFFKTAAQNKEGIITYVW